ncbi:MAG: hypothetical protein EXR51_02470 [Dehalococcoidia bacterium]|nr:hypothetical protein [Dehalococcoidia bacterium]
MKRFRSSRNVMDELTDLNNEWGELSGLLQSAYPRLRPPADFEGVLRDRLMAEARRLKASSVRDRRVSLLRRAAVGIAAVSVAGGGLALVLLRNRLGGFAVQGRPLAVHSN